jgi:hypothetical protein
MAGRLRPIAQGHAQLTEEQVPTAEEHMVKLQHEMGALINAVDEYANRLEVIARAAGANVYEIAEYRTPLMAMVARFSDVLKETVASLDVVLQSAEVLSANAAMFHLAESATDVLAVQDYPRLVHEGYERRGPGLDGRNPALPPPVPPGAMAQDGYYPPSIKKAVVTLRLPPL